MNNVDEVIYYNYKEPLKKFKGGKVRHLNFKKGYGYAGTLCYSKSTGKVQCAVCGEFYGALRDSHMEAKHKISLKEYKTLVGLAKDTALVSEETRLRCIKAGSKGKIREQGIAHGKDLKWREKQRKQLIASNKSRLGTKIELETKNKRGNCPDQLLERLKSLSEKLGRACSRKEYIAEYGYQFIGTINVTFGGWKGALRRAKLKPQSEVLSEKYSDENLLRYIREFYKQYKRPPVQSDCARGYLPDHKCYARRWGSWNNARRAAGVPTVERHSGKTWMVLKDKLVDFATIK